MLPTPGKLVRLMTSLVPDEPVKAVKEVVRTALDGVLPQPATPREPLLPCMGPSGPAPVQSATSNEGKVALGAYCAGRFGSVIKTGAYPPSARWKNTERSDNEDLKTRLPVWTGWARDAEDDARPKEDTVCRDASSVSRCTRICVHVGAAESGRR